MRRIAKIVLVLSVASFAGADVPKAQKSLVPDKPMTPEEAIAAIKRAGTRRPWVRGRATRFSFLRIVYATIQRLSPALLAGLKWLPDIRRIRVLSAPLRDDDLRQIGRIASLEDLELDGCLVKGSGLKYLKDMKNLRSLGLRARSAMRG